MPGYTLVPVDYQPDFEGVSLVPVDYDPFAEDGPIQHAPAQPASQPQPNAGFGQPPSAPPLPPIVPNGGQAPSVPQPGQDPHAHYQALRPILGDRNAMLATVYPEVRQALIAQALAGLQQPGHPSGPAPAGGVSGATQQAQTQPQPAQPAPQQPAAGIGQPGVSRPATGWPPTPTESLTNDLLALIRRNIVESAQKHIGSPAWDFNLAKGTYPEKTDKCNLFVYEMLTGAGASPGTPHGWIHPSSPRAGEWADPNYAIPGWRVLGPDESPQPGDVVAQPRDYPNGASGHVMIVGPNNTFMGVGRPEYKRAPEKIESIPKKDIIVDPPAKGPLLYRRFVGR